MENLLGSLQLKSHKGLNYLLNWPQNEQDSTELLIDNCRECLNEASSVSFFEKFHKLLRWAIESCEGIHDSVAVSQMLCYTDKMVSLFNSVHVCVRLQATKLLFSSQLEILRLVMKLSLTELDTREISSK